MNKDHLRRLGAGESIQSLCKASGLSRHQFEDWWQKEIRSRVPEMQALYAVPVKGPAKIERDSWGIPHISATTVKDKYKIQPTLPAIHN